MAPFLHCVVIMHLSIFCPTGGRGVGWPRGIWHIILSVWSHNPHPWACLLHQIPGCKNRPSLRLCTRDPDSISLLNSRLPPPPAGKILTGAPVLLTSNRVTSAIYFHNTYLAVLHRRAWRAWRRASWGRRRWGSRPTTRPPTAGPPASASTWRHHLYTSYVN